MSPFEVATIAGAHIEEDVEGTHMGLEAMGEESNIALYCLVEPAALPVSGYEGIVGMDMERHEQPRCLQDTQEAVSCLDIAALPSTHAYQVFEWHPSELEALLLHFGHDVDGMQWHCGLG